MTCHGCEGMVKITDSRVAKSPTVTFPLAQHRSIVHDSTSKREVSRQTSLLIYSFRSLGSFATWCVSSARRVRSDLHVWRDSVYSFSASSAGFGSFQGQSEANQCIGICNDRAFRRKRRHGLCKYWNMGPIGTQSILLNWTCSGVLRTLKLLTETVKILPQHQSY